MCGVHINIVRRGSHTHGFNDQSLAADNQCMPVDSQLHKDRGTVSVKLFNDKQDTAVEQAYMII